MADMYMLEKYLGLLAVLCLPGCGGSSEKIASPKSTVFIQLILESTALHKAIESMAPRINAAIKDELGLDNDFVFDFFLTKKRYALTLYYLNDMYEDGQKSLFSALDDNAKRLQPLPQKVAFSDDLNFFGKTHDELVVIMDDSTGELKALHDTTKELVYQVATTYEASHKHNLFDKTRSEQHLFLPHVTLGRIHSHSVKQYIKDPTQVDVVFNRIQERTKEIARHALKEFFTKEGRRISFTTLCVLDPQKATILKSL
jgi:2'-5' RNA ligase